MIAAKRAWLDEIVGHLKEEKEEELEGEVLGDSDTGSLLFPLLLFLINFTDQLHIYIQLYCLSYFFHNSLLQMIPKR